MKGKLMLSTILVVTLIFGSTVYAIMLNNNDYNVLNLSVVNNNKVIENIEIKKHIENYELIEYIKNKTHLTEEESAFLLKQCNEKGLNIFIVLGLMKLESNFDPNCVGIFGERGLGQLMESTARQIAFNMKKEFKPELLFDPKYNIELFTTQLKYLKVIFNGDIHKVLTAYNRGEYGLKRYMASRSGTSNPAKSTYSERVLKYAAMFQKEYQN
ncbi:lytic transglycosylase domain-containing protein [Caloranaerobacter ferrireducens]|uniref:lytic transglycosylase domain-containing protein n=1 Tax=Caloranaerobacter ferrireducens TaxID=1323370 RepID=UPI00084DCC05|nr:lytic transglycosylase domain-containing protein [Caloranaerobacter ferrireducens]